jgi:hypothetical protein
MEFNTAQLRGSLGTDRDVEDGPAESSSQSRIRESPNCPLDYEYRERVFPAELRSGMVVRFTASDGSVHSLWDIEAGPIWTCGQLTSSRIGHADETRPVRIFRQWVLHIGQRPVFQSPVGAPRSIISTPPIVQLEIGRPAARQLAS